VKTAHSRRPAFVALWLALATAGGAGAAGAADPPVPSGACSTTAASVGCATCAPAAQPSATTAARFASPGAYVRLYPAHVGRTLSPLGDLRRDALVVAGCAALYAGARLADDGVDEWVLDGHRIGGGVDRFASQRLPFFLGAAYLIQATGPPLAGGDPATAASRFEALVEALAAQGLIIEGAKHLVDRDRPNGDRYGFPSGHTGAAFAIAGLTDAALGHGPGAVAGAGAVLVGVSRVTLHKHWASDVVAGAAIGAAVGELVGRAHAVEEHSVALRPTTTPTGVPAVELRLDLGR